MREKLPRCWGSPCAPSRRGDTATLRVAPRFFVCRTRASGIGVATSNLGFRVACVARRGGGPHEHASGIRPTGPRYSAGSAPDLSPLSRYVCRNDRALVSSVPAAKAKTATIETGKAVTCAHHQHEPLLVVFYTQHPELMCAHCFVEGRLLCTHTTHTKGDSHVQTPQPAVTRTR